MKQSWVWKGVYNRGYERNWRDGRVSITKINCTDTCKKFKWFFYLKYAVDFETTVTTWNHHSVPQWIKECVPNG